MSARALIVLGLAAAVGLGGCGQSRLAGEPSRTPAGMDVRTEADRVLDDFHDAAAKADFDRYFSHWTDESVFLGTDATERWTGSEFREFARPHFEKGRGWTYRPHDRRINSTPDGEQAYFDELLDNDKLGLCRGSGVLRRVDGRWKVLQYNLSIPIPNNLAERVVGLIGLPKPDPNRPKHQE